MKEMELREHAVCDICGNKIGSTGVPLFFVVDVKEYMIDVTKMQRQDVLARAMNSGKLANIMGMDEDIATVIKSKSITMCSNCSMENITILDIIETV